MQSFIPLSVPNFSGNEKEYVNEAVVSEWVSTGGSKVGDFEQAVADYAGVPTAVACASGTAGLHLAFLVAGVGVGDEVIAPTLTFIAAVNPIRYVGAWPVFLGCDDSLNLDPDALERFCAEECTLQGGVLTNKTTHRPVRAVEVVHVFGNMADMPRILDIARRYSLVVVEDATEAIGTRYTEGPLAGQMAGTMGDVGVYSFNGNKIITTGSGGMLVSRTGAWARHAKHLSTQAKTDETQYTHDEVGYNYRMTNLQAALGLAQMEQLEEFIARKNAMYARYFAALDGKRGLRVLPFADGVRSNRWFYSLCLGDEFPLTRDELMEALKARRIQTRPIWGLVHQQPPYQSCQAFATQKAEHYHARVVNLPCSTGLSDADIDRVCEAILSCQEG